LDLWKRDAVDVLADMLQDPDYEECIDWSGQPPSAPGVYNSVTSGDWYREVRVHLTRYHLTIALMNFMQAYFDDNNQEDVFICPVIIGSDGTHLTFSGSKKAHNVYGTLGVMNASSRQKMDGVSKYNIT
jgi:hypothetical protein